MSGEGGSDHDKLQRKRIWCASQCTIPDKAGYTPNPVGTNTDMISVNPIQANHTHEFSYLPVTSV